MENLDNQIMQMDINNVREQNEAERNPPQGAQAIPREAPVPKKRPNPEPLSLIPKKVTGRPLPFVFKPAPTKRLFPVPSPPFNMVCPRAPKAKVKRQSVLTERCEDIRKRLF